MRTKVFRSLPGLLLLFAASTATGEDGRETLQKALSAHFQPSRIETGGRSGAVARAGRLLILSVDGVPAKPFRVIQANPKAPWVHVMDFARFEIARDGRILAEPGTLRLDHGTHLVVIDVKVTSSQIHLLTHTAEPVHVNAYNEPVYGCTEFVFDVAPEVIQAGSIAPVVQTIERWLESTATERLCSDGVNQLCLEP